MTSKSPPTPSMHNEAADLWSSLEKKLDLKADKEVTDIRIKQAQTLAEEAKQIALSANRKAQEDHECVKLETFETLQKTVETIKTISDTTKDQSSKIENTQIKAINRSLWWMVGFMLTVGLVSAAGYGSLQTRVGYHEESIREIKSTLTAIRAEAKDAEEKRRTREERNWAAMRDSMTLLMSSTHAGVTADTTRQAVRQAAVNALTLSPPAPPAASRAMLDTDQELSTWSQ